MLGFDEEKEIEDRRKDQQQWVGLHMTCGRHRGEF